MASAFYAFFSMTRAKRDPVAKRRPRRPAGVLSGLRDRFGSSRVAAALMARLTV